MQQESANHHVEYMDVTQHWSPSTETYAGGDALITFLYEGWEMQTDVFKETKWFGGMRQCMIYHVTLHRDNTTLVMPVMNNPYVDRLMIESELNLQEIANERSFSNK